MSDKGDRIRRNRTRASQNSGERVGIRQQLQQAASHFMANSDVEGFDDDGDLDFSGFERTRTTDFKRAPR